MFQVILSILAIATTIQSCFSSDGREETDLSFGFLSKKYPGLIASAEKVFQTTQEEKKYIQKMEQEEFFVPTAKQSLGAAPLNRDYQPILEGQEQSIKDLDCFLSTLPETGFFKVVKKEKPSPKNIIHDIVLGSEFIYEHIKTQSNGKKSVLLSLGRTPCFLHLAYQIVLQATKCKNQTAIHVNFSGNPDMDIERTSDFYVNYKALARARNIVTPEKLDHFLNYLDTKKLEGHDKIYIMDTIGKGGGINSFLKILTRYFHDRNKPLPEIEFLCLTPNISLKIFTAPSAQYEEQQMGRGVLHFSSDQKRNFYAVDVPTTIVPVYLLTLKLILDNDFCQYFGSFGIEYPAQKWTPKHDEELKNGGKYSKSITSYVKQNSHNYVKFHIQRYNPL